jgi:hypothetical protein
MKTNIKKLLSIIKNGFLNFVFIISMIAFCISAFISINTFDELNAQFRLYTKNIEKSLLNSINSAHIILYGISVALNESNIKNSAEIHKFLEAFDPRIEAAKAVKFGTITVLNQNAQSIASSAISEKNFRTQDFSNAKCIKGISKTSYELNIDSYVKGIYSQEYIIPLGMPILNIKGKYIGAICSGLVIKQLESQLMKLNSFPLVRSIQIIEKNSKDDELKGHNIKDKKYFSINIQFIKHFLKNDNLIVTQELSNIPYSIEYFIDKEVLYQNIKNKLYYLYATITYILFFVLILIVKKKYLSPLININKNLALKDNIYQNFLSQHNNLLLKEKILNQQELSIADINILIEDLIHYMNRQESLLSEFQLEKNTQVIENIDRKLHYLSLLENHYSPFHKVTGNNKSKLIKKTLGIMLKEEAHALNIHDFFTSYSGYLSDLYQVDIIHDQNHQKDLVINAKYTILCETLSSIFHFLSYHEMFDTDKGVSVYYGYNNKQLITIQIKAHLNESKDNTLRPLSWENHPAFIYMNLCTAAVLAKENKMAIDVTTENKKTVVIHLIFL